MLDFFHGKWSFERVVTSLADNRRLNNAQGQAVFAPENPNAFLSYREDGIDNNGQSFFRHYRYAAADGGITVFYGDGPQTGQLYQAYVSSPCGSFLRAKTPHLCGADIYQGIYELSNEHHFSLTTEVTGRNKNFKIETAYRRT